MRAIFNSNIRNETIYSSNKLNKSGKRTKWIENSANVHVIISETKKANVLD